MPFAEVLFTAPPPGPLPPEQALWFSFPVAAEGVRLVARQASSHGPSPTEFPLSTRYDELEATVILDDVFVPWEDVFVYRDVELSNRFFDGHVMWLAFHHLARILGRVEYTIGLALAVTDALNTNRNPAVQNVIVDMIFHAETIRAALAASCAQATISDAGVAVPHMRSLAAGTKYALENRASFADTARTLAGFGSMLAPLPADFDDPDVGSWLTQSYGGGTWTGRQRAWLLHLVRDHLASALDGREAAFESLASGGTHLWNMRVRVGYERYEELATRAMGAVDGDVPEMDFGHMRQLFAK
jgi:4-hydroxyphenylacetate 3-monooxygenase